MVWCLPAGLALILADFIFTIIFTAELAIKTIAVGFKARSTPRLYFAYNALQNKDTLHINI